MLHVAWAKIYNTYTPFKDLNLNYLQTSSQ